MKISQIISSKGAFVATITPDATIADLVNTLAEHNVGALVVSPDGQTIAGIVSERDIVRALAARSEEGRGEEGVHVADLNSTKVSEIMTALVSTCTPETSIDELMGMMTSARVRHVPVVDEESKLLAIVSIGDAVKHRLAQLEDERAALINYVTQ